jgi:hypothetical protein
MTTNIAMEHLKLFPLLEQLERMNGLCNHVEGKAPLLARPRKTDFG